MYGIYTIAAGRSLYVPMSQQPTAMLFNFLFYVFYGGAARIVLGSGLERFAVFVHLVTFAGTIVFAAVFGAYVMRRLTRCGWDEAPYLRAGLAVSVTSIVCLGPFLGWWYVAARPDAFAAGLEVAAIVLVLWGWRDRPTIGKVIVATCVFWLAWSFKQTVVFAWVGSLIYWAITRQYRAVIVSGALFGALSLCPLAIWGQGYYEHAFLGPTLNPWLVDQVRHVGWDALRTGFYVYIPAMIIAGVTIAGRHRGDADEESGYLLVIVAVALLGNVITSGREGGSRNYYLTSYFASALYLVTWATGHGANGRRWTRGPRSYSLLATLVAGLALSASFVVFPDRFGRISVADAAQLGAAEIAARAIGASAKPVFVKPAYWAQPWITNQYPSDVVDWMFYAHARARRLMVSIEERVARRRYAEAFVFPGRWAGESEAAGYERAGKAGPLIHFVRR